MAGDGGSSGLDLAADFKAIVLSAGKTSQLVGKSTSQRPASELGILAERAGVHLLRALGLADEASPSDMASSKKWFDQNAHFFGSVSMRDTTLTISSETFLRWGMVNHVAALSLRNATPINAVSPPRLQFKRLTRAVDSPTPKALLAAINNGTWDQKVKTLINNGSFLHVCQLYGLASLFVAAKMPWHAWLCLVIALEQGADFGDWFAFVTKNFAAMPFVLVDDVDAIQNSAVLADLFANVIKCSSNRVKDLCDLAENFLGKKMPMSAWSLVWQAYLAIDKDYDALFAFIVKHFTQLPLPHDANTLDEKQLINLEHLLAMTDAMLKKSSWGVQGCKHKLSLAECLDDVKFVLLGAASDNADYEELAAQVKDMQVRLVRALYWQLDKTGMLANLAEGFPLHQSRKAVAVTFGDQQLTTTREARDVARGGAVSPVSASSA